MQFSEQWLREWLNPAMNTHELAETLTLLGLEVDSVKPAAEPFRDVVVAEVLTCEKHPNADRLSLCTLNLGGGEPVQVVCGAPNVRVGLKVVFVKVGGVLPGDFKIKKAKLREVESFGMICSERELGLGDSHSGIIELPEQAPVGMSFRDYLKLDDSIIDIELTPNRGDCSSLLGIARDLAAKLDLPVTSPTIAPVQTTFQQAFAVDLQAQQACPYYAGRVIRHVDLRMASPRWLQERLRRSGLRCVNVVVDLTNYVMLELGQPMHAFDLDKLNEKLVVRFAQDKEQVTLLGGQPVLLSKENLVIADTRGVQAVAGVMGAERSAVNRNTQNIFLESAFFKPETIALSARRLGVASDSSYRFERGVDPELPVKAIERFCQLLQEICGGEFAKVNEVGSVAAFRPTAIQLRRSQIERLLGITIDDQSVVAMLTRLGMQVNDEPQGWSVWPPSYRFDLRIEADLIEELARMQGYDSLPTRQMQGELVMLGKAKAELVNRPLLSLLVDLGYLEAVTYSFVDPKVQQHFVEQGQVGLRLANPIASELSEMRLSLWPGLIQALQYNLNRQAQRVNLFETGLCFVPEAGALAQVSRLAGLRAGHAHELQWGEPERQVDFFDVKGDVEQLLQLLGLDQCVCWQKSSHLALHPGQSADVILNGVKLGSVGQLHPRIVSALDLSVAPYLFELELTKLGAKKPTQYEFISKFPAVRRDVAIVIDIAVTAEVIENLIKRSSGRLLREVKIFDIYQGEGIESGKKSVALGLTFQDSERTLLDEDVNKVVERVLADLTNALNASMRA